MEQRQVRSILTRTGTALLALLAGTALAGEPTTEGSIKAGQPALDNQATQLKSGAPEPEPTTSSPWGGNLTLYMWFPGVKGNYSAGPLSESVNASFIDIAGKLRNFPMAFMGRLEGYYDRAGLFLDGNYMQMDFKPRFDNGITKGLSTQLSLIEYGGVYRLFGAPASLRHDHWEEQGRSNSLDVYVGARTIMMTNSISTQGNRNPSANATLTAPMIGGRGTVEFSPSWFVTADLNIGGFGVDNVNLTGAITGLVGYKTRLFGQPVSFDAGYKALRVDISKPIIESRTTFNGAFLGVTTYW